MQPDAHARQTPDQLRFFCNLCPAEARGFEGIADHLEQAHGQTMQRWPDGQPVIDMSDVPELIEPQDS